MDVKKDKQLTDDLLYLVWCSLHGKCPQKERIEHMNLEQLYQVSRKNDLVPTLWPAIEAFYGKDIPQTALYQEWRTVKEKVVRKNILMDLEREKLYRWMDEKCIWHMSLKGIRLKKYYPKELRAMADNDILFDADFQMDVCHWFEKQGYQVEMIGKSNHDVYCKEPIYNFEMHTLLYGEDHDLVWKEYYQNVKEKLIRAGEDTYEYTFDREEEYVYLLTHFYKHYYGSGTGLRSLVDIAVYRKQYPDLQKGKIRKSCEILGLTEFEEMVERLTDQLLATDESKIIADVSEKDVDVLLYMTFAGTYGNYNIYVQNSLKKLKGECEEAGWKLRCRYIWNRLFPDYEWIRKGYPRLGRYHVLKPLLYLYRLLRAVIVRRKRVWKEMEILNRESRHL